MQASCKNCDGVDLELDWGMIGQTVECPSCKAKFIVVESRNGEHSYLDIQKYEQKYENAR